jgi:hypothetical protein
MEYSNSSITGKALNHMFIQKMDDRDWSSKMAEAGASYIRDILRETSFARKILPPEQVSRGDLQRSTVHEGVTKIVDVEPNSRAFIINWRSQAPGRWIYSRRVEFQFFTITTERYEKTEQELMTYEMPITKIIEQNAIKDIQSVEDDRFIQSAEAAVAASGLQQIKASANPLNKRDLANAFKMLDSNRQRAETLLMTTALFDDILGLDYTDLGDKMASEIIVNGYAYNNLLGHKLVTTIKDDIIPNNEVWIFAPPEFLGKFFILNNPKFWIDKEANLVRFQAWEDVALGIRNSKAVSVLRLNNGAPFPIV